MLVNINTTVNSWRSWLLAARPKTLSGAAVPVMLGIVYAYSSCPEAYNHNINGILCALLCLLFAFIMQIDANFINDYYDCLKGRDTAERLGPERACQQGFVTMSAMKKAIVLTTIFAAITGLVILYVVYLRQPNIIPTVTLITVGALCIIFSFLYTTCLAQKGLGDLLVIIFFGIIPVYFTAYSMMVTVPSALFLLGTPAPSIITQIDWRLVMLGISCGLVTDTLLIVNNYRDIDNDKKCGKLTLVVLLGKRYTEYLYLTLPTLALVIVLCFYGWIPLNIFLTFPVYFLYIGSWQGMKQIGQGRELNKILGKTARNIFIFGVLTTIIILIN